MVTLLRKSLCCALLAALLPPAMASSHREAPFITKNPKADATDFYMFHSYEPGREKYITLIANYLSLQDAYGGPNFFTLDPEALYDIHIDNDGDARKLRRIHVLTVPIGSTKCCATSLCDISWKKASPITWRCSPSSVAMHWASAWASLLSSSACMGVASGSCSAFMTSISKCSESISTLPSRRRWIAKALLRMIAAIQVKGAAN